MPQKHPPASTATSWDGASAAGVSTAGAGIGLFSASALTPQLMPKNASATAMIILFIDLRCATAIAVTRFSRPLAGRDLPSWRDFEQAMTVRMFKRLFPRRD